MAEKKLSEYPNVTAVAGTDYVPCIQDSTNKKITLAQMLEYIRSTGFSHSPSITSGSSTNSILFDFNPTTSGAISSSYTYYNGIILSLDYNDSDDASKLHINGTKTLVTIGANSGDLASIAGWNNGVFSLSTGSSSYNTTARIDYVEFYGSNTGHIRGTIAQNFIYNEVGQTHSIHESSGALFSNEIWPYAENAVINVTTSYGLDIYSGCYADNYSGCQANITNNYGAVLKTGCYKDTSGSASITNNYGLYIKNDVYGNTSNGTITNHYGLYLDSFALATNEWGIYSAGSAAKNYFNGPVTIGTTAASAKIHAISTTEQLRLGYDASNYASFTVSSAGVLTLATSANKIALGASRTPASATASGTAGEVCWDADFLYVCVSANTWKRTALSSW